MSTAEVLTPLPKIVRDEFDKDNYEIIDGVRVELPPIECRFAGSGFPVSSPSEQLRHRERYWGSLR